MRDSRSASIDLVEMQGLDFENSVGMLVTERRDGSRQYLEAECRCACNANAARARGLQVGRDMTKPVDVLIDLAYVFVTAGELPGVGMSLPLTRSNSR